MPPPRREGTSGRDVEIGIVGVLDTDEDEETRVQKWCYLMRVAMGAIFVAGRANHNAREAICW